MMLGIMDIFHQLFQDSQVKYDNDEAIYMCTSYRKIMNKEIE